MRMPRRGLPVLASIAAVVVCGTPASAGHATQAATVVAVTAGKPTEFAFQLSRTTVPAGAVTFEVTNTGTIVHDFSIAGRRTRKLAPGHSQTITVRLAKPGRIPYLCTLPGHAAAGMKGALTVRAAAAARTRVKASLGAAAVPRAKANRRAAGSFAGTLSGRTLSWRLTFARLTGRATSAHIHAAKPGTAGSAGRTLCRPCRSPSSGRVALSRAQVAALEDDRLYVDVHTVRNPGGEIRGRLRTLPPAT
jgi:uncharacterized cupredoxin-like copper-binding protein